MSTPATQPVAMPINATMPMLLPGDTFLSRSEGTLGGGIRLWQTVASGKSETNHVGGIVRGGTPQQAMASEAVGHVRTVNFWRVYQNQPIRIYRHRTLTPEQRDNLAAEWEKAEGTGYAWLRMGPFIADSIGAWVKRVVLRKGDGSDFYLFSKWLKITSYRVCSNHWAHGWEAVIGEKLGGRPWQSHTPDSIEDYFDQHRDQWELIWDTVTPTPKAESESESFLNKTQSLLNQLTPQEA